MMLRRLIGPTVITLLACLLWVDYILFRERSWSVVNFLSQALTIIGRVFGPFFSAELYGWIGDILIPAGMIVAAIFLLYVSVAAAKVAMRRATPPANEPLLPSSYASLAEPVHAAEPLAPKASGKPWKFTLAGKLTSSFAALAVIFAASVSIIAYARLAATFENEMKRRAELSVMGLAELALRYGDRGGELQLRHAVEDYASDLSIAYVYVEDPQGRIIAHMPRDLPAFLLRDFPRTAERAITGVEVSYRDLPVYEIAARVGKNQFGYVHLGMWRHAVQAETRNVVTSIVVSILLLLCAITAVFAWAVCYFTLPLSKLVLYAHRVSRGDLDVDIEMKESEAIKQNNEVGSLARSFARMRSSLHAILTRLEGSQQKNPFNEFR